MGDSKITYKQEADDATWASVSSGVNVLDVTVGAHTCTVCLLDSNSWWLLKNEEVGCCRVTLRFVRGCGSCQEALFIQEEMVVWLLHHRNPAHWSFLPSALKCDVSRSLGMTDESLCITVKLVATTPTWSETLWHHSSLYQSVRCSLTGPKRWLSRWVFSFRFVHSEVSLSSSCFYLSKS